MKTTSINRKEHWEKIYRSKQPNEMSWHQDVPVTSLEFFMALNLPKSAWIFDNGAGDSYFVDHLLQMGYDNITVQDISESAINKVKERLGQKAVNVCWMVEDEADCHPGRKYDVWHDRAAFHFLTKEEEIQNYIRTIGRCIKLGGYFIISTFSEKGPATCSGLPVHRYSEADIESRLNTLFTKVKCITQDHITPFGTKQNFLFCVFRRK